MTREQKLQAVVDAARGYVAAVRPAECKRTYDAMVDALAALDAPDTADETVTLEFWAHRDGDVVPLLPGSFISRDWETSDFRRRLGTVTLPITRERGE